MWPLCGGNLEGLLGHQAPVVERGAVFMGFSASYSQLTMKLNPRRKKNGSYILCGHFYCSWPLLLREDPLNPDFLERVRGEPGARELWLPRLPVRVIICKAWLSQLLLQQASLSTSS